jgi:agmatine deiminase
MPAEFEPHSGCLMLWPYRSDSWRENAIPAAKTFATVANLISTSEKVFMGTRKASFGVARRFLSPAVQMIELEYNDSWMRDIGPTFIKNRQTKTLRGIDWDFNAWGGETDGLYEHWEKDSKVCQRLFDFLRADHYKPRVVLEGGAIHVDGKGTLIAVEECVLNENRNPTMTKAKMEAIFRDYLGIEKIIWIPQGVYNDETNGHVDNLCCFAPDGVVLLTWTDDTTDPQHPISQKAFEILNNEVNAQGQPIVVEKIRQPQPMFMNEKEYLGLQEGSAKKRFPGDRLTGSYINFYIANHVVILPVFDVPEDECAIDKIQSHFPERQVIPVYSREVLLGGGNIHCITQQIPQGQF